LFPNQYFNYTKKNSFVKYNILNYLQFYIELICIFATIIFTTIKLKQ